MNLKCAQRGDMESESNPIHLCHHCGKPVCAEHGTMVLADDAFADSDSPLPRFAMHCPECARHHNKGDGRRTGAGAAQ